MKLVCVTASTSIQRAEPCFASWGDVPLIIVLNGQPGQHGVSDNLPTYGRATVLYHSEYLGTVPAFKTGVDYALGHTDADIIANLHDDLIIQDPAWAEKVIRRFEQQPAIGLLGFGGAIGLGDSDIYQKPYQPQQLARIGFRSNLQDAEVHGIRSLLAERVGCLDGFSQIGRRAFWQGIKHIDLRAKELKETQTQADGQPWSYLGQEQRPWDVLQNLGVMHHAYDGMLGCLAARYGWETWFLPVRCRHLGGQTAVGDQGYQQWAQQQIEGGDHGFWQAAHQIWYDNFKDVLPLRL